MRLQHQEFEIFADYHQFYLWDNGTDPQAPTHYTNDDVQRHIKTGSTVVVVNPIRDMTVNVEVEVHYSEPVYEPGDWDHVVEASLHLPTGQLQVHECTGGPAAEFEVEPGWYRVRACFGGLDTIDEDEMEGDDFYRVVLWPSPEEDVRVIKQWVDK